jgi:cell division protease FtsH
MSMGGGRDPTTAWQDTTHDEAILALQRGAHARATRLVRQRRGVIERVAAELCDTPDETVLGARIVELLQTTPLGEAEEEAAGAESTPGGGGGGAAAREVLGELLASEDGRALAELVMGKVADWDLVPGSVARQKAAQVRRQLLDSEARARLESVARYASGKGAFPRPPGVPEDKGPDLTSWLPAGDEQTVIQL